MSTQPYTLRRALVALALAFSIAAVGCEDAPTAGPNGDDWPSDVPKPPGVPSSERIFPSIAVEFYIAGTCADSVRLVIDGDVEGRNVAARKWGYVQIIAEAGTEHRVSIRKAGSTATTWGPFIVTRDTAIVARCP